MGHLTKNCGRDEHFQVEALQESETTDEMKLVKGACIIFYQLHLLFPRVLHSNS